MKFLAADIGNTSIHFAYHEKGKWVKHFSVSSRISKSQLRKILLNKYGSISDTTVAIASVVPALGIFLRYFFLKNNFISVTLIGKDKPVPIDNLYANPAQVGVDRLLNAYAAYLQYHRELVVIDFGTAITFDIVNKKGQYLGGVIAPGIEISLEALFQKTALLPKIKLKHPTNWIGRNTAESIRVGCSVGIGGLCDRVVESIAKQYRMKPLVVATGGYAMFMRRYCDSIQIIEPYLILEGIYQTALNPA